MDKSNDLFYCYSCKMKDFIKSQGLNYLTKAKHPKTNRIFFIFKRGEELDKAIVKWQEINEYKEIKFK